MISKQNLPLQNTFRTYQHLKIILTVLIKSLHRRKSQVVIKKKKLGFVFSHNSHCVWEWSITEIKNKTNFVVWKNLHAHRFSKRALFIIFSFRFERYISIRIERTKNLESFKTSRLCTPRWRRHLGCRLNLLSMRIIAVMISLKLWLIIRQRFMSMTYRSN